VRVEESVGVAEDLEVDAAERRIGGTAGKLDRLTEPVHAVQKVQPPGSGQVSQAANCGNVTK
jgi:hypothetical protein